MQKGFAPIFILVGILVLVSVGGIYFFKVKTPVQKACTMEAKICPDGSSVGRVGPNCEFSPCPQTSSSPSPDETANWKTYTNNQHWFSLKYPTGWFVGVSNDGTILFDKNPINGTNTVEPDQIAITLEIVTDPQLIDLYIKNPPGTVENRVIGSISFDYIAIKTDGGQPSKQVIFAQTQHNTKLYRLGLSDRASKDIFNQVLSTFKFLDQK